MASISISGEYLYYKNDDIELSSKVDQYLLNKPDFLCSASCQGMITSRDTINYLNGFGYYPRTIISKFSSMLMHGVGLQIGNSISKTSNNLQISLKRGDNIKDQCYGSKINKQNQYMIYKPDFPIYLQFLSSAIKLGDNNNPTCITYDLCGDILYLSFTNGDVDILQHVQNIMSDIHFDAFKISGISYDITKGLNAQASMKLQYGKLSMKLDGEISISSDSSPVKDLFVSSAQTILSHYGKLEISTQLPILNGKLISLALTDDQGKIDCSFGKNSSKIVMKIISKGKIISSSSIFHMEPNNKIQIDYDSNILGGKIIGVKQDRIFTMWLRSFMSMERVFNQFFNKVKSQNLQSMEIIQFHYNKAKSMVTTLQGLLTVESTEYLLVLRHFTSLKDAMFDFSNSLKAFSMETPLLQRDVERIIRRLNRFNTLHITPLVNSMTFMENGLKFLYDGKFCYHKLCFKDVSITVSSPTQNDQIIIKVSTKFQQKISSRLTMIPGQNFILNISKNDNIISGTFNANIRYYQNKETQVTFTLTKESIQYEISDFNLIPLFDFKVSGKRNVQTVTWASVLYTLQGEAKINEQFGKLCQDVFEEESLNFLQRQKLINNQVEKCNKELLRRADDLRRVEKNYISSKKSFLKSKALHDISVLQLKANQTTMSGYLKFQPKLIDLIERDVNSICMLKSCKKTCLSMPVCKVCQEEVEIPTTIMKCQQNEEKIRTTRLEQVNSLCDLKRYLFTTVYTGSCPNPTDHGQKQGALEASLIATGTALGSLIGGPLGGVIGGIVGFLGGLFSSCSKSYEVIKSSFTIQKECTKLTKVVETIIRPYSVCLNEQINVKTGYSLPKQCKCSLKECVVKMENPTCIEENYECRKKRNTFIRSTNDIPKAYIDLQNNIENLQDEVEENRLIYDRMKLDKERSERKLKEANNLFEKAKRISTFSNKTKMSFKVRLGKELCHAKLYKQYHNISNIIGLKKINFDISIPILDYVKLSFEVASNLDSGIKQVPIVYEVDEFNMTSVVKMFLNKAICENNQRKRRSLVEGTGQASIASSIAQNSCLKVRNALNILNKTAQILKQVTQDAIQRLAVRDNIKDMKILSSNNTIKPPIVSAQRKLLQEYSESVLEYQSRSNSLNVAQLAQEELEILISLQNGTDCFNAKDCINKAFEDLQTQSVMGRPAFKDYRDNLLQMKDKLMDTINENTKRNLFQISKMIKTFQNNLVHLNQTSNHCSRPPNITSTFKPQINVRKGESTVLVCKTTSDLPIQYYWYKDDELIDGEESDTLIINAMSSSIAGGYKCFVSSKVGQTQSNETLIFVYDLPRFTEEPKHFDYILPSDGQLPRFYCNATGTPEPSIQWFYHKTSTDKGVPLKNESSSELVIKNPKPNHSGFYSCKATNQFGMNQSRKGMLRVVTATLPEQSLLITIRNTSKATITSLKNYNDLVEYLTENKGQEVEVSINMTNYQVSLSITSNPRSISPKFSSRLEMLDFSSQIRRDLSSSAAKFLNFLTVQDTKELSYNSTLNHCEEGSRIHKNNFMCVPCMPGRYGNNCQLCSKGMYQPNSGSKTCRKCPDGKTTESKGATSLDQCVSKNAGIVFVVDASVNTRLEPIKGFLRETFKTLTDGKTLDFKFALLTYCNGFDVLSTFDGDSKKFLSSISKLESGKFGWRFLHLGIQVAGKLLKTLPKEIENRFIVIISNGRVDGSYYHSGFTLARKASLHVQDQFNKINIISVNRYKDVHDVRTLYGISSQPKVLNTVIGNTWSETRTKLIDRIFKQNENYSTNLDIGLLFIGGAYQLHQNIDKTYNFLVKLQSNLPKSKFNFLQNQWPSRDHIFKIYPASSFAEKLRRSLREIMLRSNKQNKIKLLQKSLNDVMNEDHNSFSPKKIILMFSSNGISMKDLKMVNRVYKKEKFVLINILYDENISLENKKDLEMVNHVWMYSFKYFQSQNVINLLKELRQK